MNLERALSDFVNAAHRIGRMKLPNASLVIVAREKIADYLLNPTHSSDAGKAKFFVLFGFRREHWQELEAALRKHVLTQEVAVVKETGFGRATRWRDHWTRQAGAVRWCAACGSTMTAWLPASHHGLCFGGQTMIQEHDSVVLTHDLPDESLQAGDVGAVVHIRREGEAYEVEFTSLAEQTLCVATVMAADLRPVTRRDVAHVRELVLV